MVELVEECELGIGREEVLGILRAVARRAAALGLKEPVPVVIRVYCDRPPKGLIEVSRGVLVGEGVVAVRGNVLPNLAYEELILGFISLSLLETLGEADREFAVRFLEDNFLAIVREAAGACGEVGDGGEREGEGKAYKGFRRALTRWWNWWKWWKLGGSSRSSTKKSRRRSPSGAGRS